MSGVAQQMPDPVAQTIFVLTHLLDIFLGAFLALLDPSLGLLGRIFSVTGAILNTILVFD